MDSIQNVIGCVSCACYDPFLYYLYTAVDVYILGTEQESVQLIVYVQVVSLLHYDDAEQGTKVDPSPGYPLVCINVSMTALVRSHSYLASMHVLQDIV